MRRVRKVELLGCGLTIGSVPPHDPEAERWGLNALMYRRFGGQFDDWTRWFDLHGTAHIQQHRPEAYAWYAQQSKPIYRWAHDPAIPASVPYPKDTVQTYFGGETDFACSLSWMLALAIVDGFDAIDLFWFPLDGNEVGYQQQIPSVAYWIGQARGRGIRVTIHGDSSLKPSGLLYGWQTT